MRDLTFQTKEGTLNIRSAAIILCNDRLLVSKKSGSPYEWLPGGRVHMNETSEQACDRECIEELGMSFPNKRLLCVHENFFTEEISQRFYHEICFYYLIALKQCPNPFAKECFTYQESDGSCNLYRWVAISSLSHEKIRPPMLAKLLRQIPDSPLHIVTKEE